jgi:xanthosine phosphorylase
MTKATPAIDEAAPAAALLKQRLGRLKPRVAIVLGSGLSGIADSVERPVIVDYTALPGFPPTGVEGHRGQAIAGRLAGAPVLCLAGRAHAYEALPPTAYRVPVRALYRLGVEVLLLTNAAGSLRRGVGPGEIMMIADHINMLGMNPLVGANDERYGPRFPAMTDVYDLELRRALRTAARRARIPLAEGVYAAYPGPSFETPAEIRALRKLGADAVGMSTVPEAIVARHCGLRVAGLSVITNLAAGMSAASPSHEETLRAATAAAARLSRLVGRFLEEFT